MEIFARKISYVTVDTTIERYSTLGTQLFFELRCHHETENQLAFCSFSDILS
jgi:hypothetical protein